MTATRHDIQGWIQEAQQQRATHLIIMHDTFDHENYPVFVSAVQDAHREAMKHCNNMQVIEEVYSFTGKYPLDFQLNERRAIHYD
jgi:hypothetical protein